MKNHPFFLLLAFVLCSVPHTAMAEKADRNKPISFEADATSYDALKQVSVLTGSVILTKGTIYIRGAKVELREDPEGFQFGVITSSPSTPAFFRQKLEGVDEFVEGEAELIEYDGRTDTVRFIKKAQWRRLRGASLADEVQGALIVYNNLTETLTVDGNASKPVSGSSGGRVRGMLTPKADAGASPAAAPAVLRPSTSLEGNKK
ncbi:MAG: lipopolysaccharide transport periplasmic protein LptA [Burkholderiales bacterium PBB4]|nr:MAG: lipopolysaccharide transport periplasmic protein LptA [Burkholderiales bacterium PBB4]